MCGKQAERPMIFENISLGGTSHFTDASMGLLAICPMNDAMRYCICVCCCYPGSRSKFLRQSPVRTVNPRSIGPLLPWNLIV